jgi:hypothetical protein
MPRKTQTPRSRNPRSRPCADVATGASGWARNGSGAAIPARPAAVAAISVRRDGSGLHDDIDASLGECADLAGIDTLAPAGGRPRRAAQLLLAHLLLIECDRVNGRY